MLARLAHATGTLLRLAAPGITGVDLGGAAWLDPAARLPARMSQHVPRFRHQPTGAVAHADDGCAAREEGKKTPVRFLTRTHAAV
jgi:hypothetical protein